MLVDLTICGYLRLELDMGSVYFLCIGVTHFLRFDSRSAAHRHNELYSTAFYSNQGLLITVGL